MGRHVARRSGTVFGAVALGVVVGFLARDLRTILTVPEVSPTTVETFARSVIEACEGMPPLRPAAVDETAIARALSTLWADHLMPDRPLRFVAVDVEDDSAVYRWLVDGDIGGLVGFCANEDRTLFVGFVEIAAITPTLGGSSRDATGSRRRRPAVVVRLEGARTLAYSDVFGPELVQVPAGP